MYFRTYAKSLGFDADSVGDLEVWEFIIAYQKLLQECIWTMYN